jgi:Putative Ig domain
MKRLHSLSLAILSMCLLSGCGSNTHMSTTPLTITMDNAPAGATAVSYNGSEGFALVATGGTPPYHWSWAPARNSALPPGLRLDGDSISGTPAASGDFAVIVTVTDSGYPAAQASTALTVSVDATLAIASGAPPNGTVGVGYGPLGTIYRRCVVVTGTSGPVWSCARCNPSISGSCPTALCPSSISLYRVPCLKTSSGDVGFTLKASGGAAPYIWASKGLPPGLFVYSKLGIIGGTPTTAGTYSVTIYVKDSEPTPQQTEAHYSIQISPASCSKLRCSESLPCCPGYVCQPVVIGPFPSGFCVRSLAEAPGGQTLNGQTDREVPPLRLDTLPGITGSSADSADPQ